MDERFPGKIEYGTDSNDERVIPVIPEDLQYWFVRTEGGLYFDDFYFDQFIAIDWDEFCDLKYITEVDPTKFKEQIKEKYKDEERPGLACGQMKKFVVDMKQGDIVMIPNTNSERIAFGVVTSNAFIDETARIYKIDDDEDITRCKFKKRRSVKWVLTAKRDNLDPYLFRMMYAHNTITNASDYASFIDRMINSLYIKGGVGHLVLHVTKEDHVAARDLARLIDRTIGLLDHPEDLIDTDSVEVKVNVQSPGPVEFIAAAGILFTLACLMHYCVGGNLDLKISDTEVAAKIETDGFLEKLLKLRQQNHDHKIELRKAMEKLDTKIPEQLLPGKSKEPLKE
jgi:hypothetical protein